MIQRRRPKLLGELIEVVDQRSPWYKMQGYRYADRKDGTVVVYFKANDTTGYLIVLEWSQCARV